MARGALASRLRKVAEADSVRAFSASKYRDCASSRQSVVAAAAVGGFAAMSAQTIAPGRAEPKFEVRRFEKYAGATGKYGSSPGTISRSTCRGHHPSSA